MAENFGILASEICGEFHNSCWQFSGVAENFRILAFEFWNSCWLISRVAENLGLLAGESGGEFDDSSWREWRRIGQFLLARVAENLTILAGESGGELDDSRLSI